MWLKPRERAKTHLRLRFSKQISSPSLSLQDPSLQELSLTPLAQRVMGPGPGAPWGVGMSLWGQPGNAEHLALECFQEPSARDLK